MAIKTTTGLVIFAEYATDFQKEIAQKALVSMITAWENHYKSTHKKNKITIKLNWATAEKI